MRAMFFAFHAVLFLRPLVALQYYSGRKHSRVALIAFSVAADFLLQLFAGQTNLWAWVSVLAGGIVLLVLPPKLGAAAATLAPAQLIPGFFLLALIPYWGGYSLWSELPGIALRFWAPAAFVWLLLVYIRTPKKDLA